MVQEEDVLGDAPDGWEMVDGGVVDQVRVDDGADEAGHLAPHAVLGVERGAVHAVIDEPLEQRHVQVVLGAKLQHGGLRPQLLVVA